MFMGVYGQRVRRLMNGPNCDSAFRRRQPHVGVVGQLGGPPAGTIRQVAFGQRLQPPGDPLDEPGLVASAGLFAEDLGVA